MGRLQCMLSLNLDFYKNHNEEIILTDLAKVLILLLYLGTCNSQRSLWRRQKKGKQEADELAKRITYSHSLSKEWITPTHCTWGKAGEGRA